MECRLTRNQRADHLANIVAMYWLMISEEKWETGRHLLEVFKAEYDAAYGVLVYELLREDG